MALTDIFSKLFFPQRVTGSARNGTHGPLRTNADVQALLIATDATPATATLQRYARACFHIVPHADATQSPVGCSRLGGKPDLAPGATWPAASDGKLLTFYGQINTEEIAAADAQSRLPARGLLSIFAGSVESSSGSIIVQTVFTPPGTRLLPLSLPDEFPGFSDERTNLLNPVRIQFEPGLSFPTEMFSFSREIGAAAPNCDIDALVEGLVAAPKGALGQLFGYAPTPGADVHTAAYFAENGRDGQDRLVIWETWDNWQRAKTISSRMANGQIYRPWSASDDENVRWILANPEAIASGVGEWHSLICIRSNALMNLWINDADPIFFLAKADESGFLDLSRVRACATQS